MGAHRMFAQPGDVTILSGSRTTITTGLEARGRRATAQFRCGRSMGKRWGGSTSSRGRERRGGIRSPGVLRIKPKNPCYEFDSRGRCRIWRGSGQPARFGRVPAGKPACPTYQRGSAQWLQKREGASGKTCQLKVSAEQQDGAILSTRAPACKNPLHGKGAGRDE